MMERLKTFGLARPKGDGPAVLNMDIETTPLLSWTWGRFRQDVIAVEQHSYMLSFAYSWYGQPGPIRWVGLPQNPEYEPPPLGADFSARYDRWVVERLHALIDAADVVMYYNGDRFDAKKANTRFSVYGLGPPSPYRSVDLLKESRRYTDQPSHSLRNVSEFYGLAGKGTHEGFPLWRGCMAGDSAAWRKMERYNKQDVRAVEDYWDVVLKPWVGHPGHTQGVGFDHWRPGVCPKCGAEGTLIKRGFHRTMYTVRQTLQCSTARGGCGGYTKGTVR